MVPDRWCDEPAVSCCWQTHPGMGCGIRRTSGDKVTIEEPVSYTHLTLPTIYSV